MPIIYLLCHRSLSHVLSLLFHRLDSSGEASADIAQAQEGLNNLAVTEGVNYNTYLEVGI